MKQGDLIKFFVQNLGSNGEGVGKMGDHYVYVPFALPQEFLSARVLFAKRNTVFATPKEILKPSSHRVEPRCPKFGKCGGCQLQHADYETQLEFKRECVKQNLSKIGGLTVEVLPTVPSQNQWKYRNKVQFPVGERDGKPVVGFFKNDTHTLVQVDECPLQDDHEGKQYSHTRHTLCGKECVEIHTTSIELLPNARRTKLLISSSVKLLAYICLL